EYRDTAAVESRLPGGSARRWTGLFAGRTTLRLTIIHARVLSRECGNPLQHEAVVRTDAPFTVSGPRMLDEYRIGHDLPARDIHIAHPQQDRRTACPTAAKEPGKILHVFQPFDPGTDAQGWSGLRGGLLI